MRPLTRNTHKSKKSSLESIGRIQRLIRTETLELVRELDPGVNSKPREEVVLVLKVPVGSATGHAGSCTDRTKRHSLGTSHVEELGGCADQRLPRHCRGLRSSDHTMSLIDNVTLTGHSVNMTKSHEDELVVVSGASTGMGAATARELARQGFQVLAGVRRPTDADAIRDSNIEPVILDITVPDDIDALVRRVSDDPGRRQLRAVVNNAGIAVNAPVETLPLDQWRRQFEVNLFGHIALTQALLPFLHNSHGRIVNISSVGGRIAMGTYGAYAGAKFALEAVSDSLRRELFPHGVQVVVVEPGGVTTEMAGHGIQRARAYIEQMTPIQRQRYGGLMEAVINQSAAFTKAGVSADKAALVIVEAVTAQKPRTRYTIGRDAALLIRLARILPDRTLDRVIAANLRPHFTKPTADQPLNTR